MAQDWPGDWHLLAAIANELKALRSDLSQVQFKPILPPSAVREQEQKQALVRTVHDDIHAQLRGVKRS